LDIQCLGAIEFPDHFDYDADSVTAIISQASSVDAKAIVTSAKDWVKLREFSWSLPVWVITARSEVNEKEFFASLLKDATQPDNLS
jgi:tetraacyldisaccharide-1-P 4'-kinase